MNILITGLHYTGTSKCLVHISQLYGGKLRYEPFNLKKSIMYNRFPSSRYWYQNKNNFLHLYSKNPNLKVPFNIVFSSNKISLYNYIYLFLNSRLSTIVSHFIAYIIFHFSLTSNVKVLKDPFLLTVAHKISDIDIIYLCRKPCHSFVYSNIKRNTLVDMTTIVTFYNSIEEDITIPSWLNFQDIIETSTLLWVLSEIYYNKFLLNIPHMRVLNESDIHSLPLRKTIKYRLLQKLAHPLYTKVKINYNDSFDKSSAIDTKISVILEKLCFHFKFQPDV